MVPSPEWAAVRGACASAARGLALLVGLLLLVAGAVEAQTTVPGAPTIDTVTAGSGTTLVVDLDRARLRWRLGHHRLRCALYRDRGYR